MTLKEKVLKRASELKMKKVMDFKLDNSSPTTDIAMWKKGIIAFAQTMKR